MQDFKNINKKKAGKNLIFLLIFAIMIFALSKLFYNISLQNEQFIQGRNKCLFRAKTEEKNSVDVIMTGDSLSYSSISPVPLWDDYGIRMAVYGQPGQKIQETYYILKEAFKRQRPELVVLETNVMFRGKDGIESLQDSIEEWGNHNISLLRTHNLWKTFIMDVRYKEENFKGYVFKTDIVPYKKGKYMIKNHRKYPIPGHSLEYMNKIQKLCEEHGAELLLISVPSPKNYGYRKHNALKSYAKKNGLRYLDMNLHTKKMGVDWSVDSCDGGDHLNFIGAQKATERLGLYLDKYYTLKNHKKDKNNDAWYHLKSLYDQKMAKYKHLMK